jgi:hypothetical protein
LVEVPATIDARPAELDPARMDGTGEKVVEFNDARLALAETYWQKEFAPLATPAYSRAN